jgi:hypothetical protein
MIKLDIWVQDSLPTTNPKYSEIFRNTRIRDSSGGIEENHRTPQIRSEIPWNKERNSNQTRSVHFVFCLIIVLTDLLKRDANVGLHTLSHLSRGIIITIMMIFQSKQCDTDNTASLIIQKQVTLIVNSWKINYKVWSLDPENPNLGLESEPTDTQSFFLIFLMGWDWIHLACRPLIGLLYHPQMIDDKWGSSRWNENWYGKPSTRRKSAPAQLSPPQIPHDLTWDGTRTPRWKASRLSAWAIARRQKKLMHVGGARSHKSRTLTPVHVSVRSRKSWHYSWNSPKRNKVKELNVAAHSSQTILASGVHIWGDNPSACQPNGVALMIRWSEISEGGRRSKHVTIPPRETN